jgi:hypothetical protein
MGIFVHYLPLVLAAVRPLLGQTSHPCEVKCAAGQVALLQARQLNADFIAHIRQSFKPIG